MAALVWDISVAVIAIREQRETGGCSDGWGKAGVDEAYGSIARAGGGGMPAY